MSSRSIQLVEMTLRDGLQSVAEFVPTQIKIEWMRSLYAAGIRRIEATSFVSPLAVPQMSDAAEVLTAAQSLGDLDASVLVPTARYAERALRAGAKHLVFVLSVSEAHNQNNVKRSTTESIREYSQVVALLAEGQKLRLNLATAFDCPMTGRVKPEAVMALLSDLVPIAPWAEVALCDTTGRASPADVANLFSAAARHFPAIWTWAFHGHDTYGMGCANVLAAWQAGVRVIDASCAGLGGCPFAPGATGNVATEDIVWMMQGMNVSTGVNLEQLCAAAQQIAALPGAQTGGRVRHALESSARRAAMKS